MTVENALEGLFRVLQTCSTILLAPSNVTRQLYINHIRCWTVFAKNKMAAAFPRSTVFSDVIITWEKNKSNMMLWNTHVRICFTIPLGPNLYLFSLNGIVDIAKSQKIPSSQDTAVTMTQPSKTRSWQRNWRRENLYLSLNPSLSIIYNPYMARNPASFPVFFLSTYYSPCKARSPVSFPVSLPVYYSPCMARIPVSFPVSHPIFYSLCMMWGRGRGHEILVYLDIFYNCLNMK